MSSIVTKDKIRKVKDSELAHSTAMTILDKVHFNPTGSVTFQPDATKQQAMLEVKNMADKPVMLKMKSTRPGLFKMRPVFDVLQAGEKKTIRLIYKGLKPHMQPVMKDHFTVVLAPAPATTAKVDKLWKQHKYHEKMAQSETHKKHIMILYAGINDKNQPQKMDPSEGVSTKKVGIKKGKGLVDDEEVKPILIPSPSGRGPPILLMYRPSEPIFDEDSDTDNENDDDEDGKTVGDPTVEAASLANTAAAFPKATLIPSSTKK